MRKGRSHTRRTALGSCAVLLAISVGCSVSTGSPAPPQVCAAEPGVSADAVRLGFVLSDSGGAASQVTGARAGIEARLGSQNDRGGVHGRRIEYEWRDDQSNPAQNLLAARDLVEREKVFGLLSATSVASASADYLRGLGIPVVGLAMEAAWSTHDNMVSYLNRLPTTAVFDTLGQFARLKGVRRAVIVSMSASAASTVGAQRIERILRQAGIEIVGTIDYAAAGSAPAAMGRQIVQSGADGLFGALAGDHFAEVYNGAVTAGARLEVGLGISGYGHKLLNRQGSRLGGAYFYLTYQPFEAGTPAQQAYLDALAHYAPELDPPDAQAAVEAYITADLLVKGLEGAGPCPTRSGLFDALGSISNFDGAGLLPGSVDLTKGFGQSARCLTFVRVNQAGTAFDVDQPSLCGQPLPGPVA